MSRETMTTESVMDLAEAMDNMGGDVELLEEIIQIFLESGPDQLAAIAGEIEAGNTDEVAILAHTMKGGASNFCARRFVDAALALEMQAKSGSLNGAGDMLEKMREAFAEIGEVARVVNWEEVARRWQD